MIALGMGEMSQTTDLEHLGTTEMSGDVREGCVWGETMKRFINVICLHRNYSSSHGQFYFQTGGKRREVRTSGGS